MDPEKPWLKFTKENVDKVPEKQGVYEIAYVTPEGKKLWRLGRRRTHISGTTKQGCPKTLTP
jgi:hypothetical protein